ncbi:hypothetical protein NMY22_g11202 [Coprinellus aureogranulatus]|nr:hypothetical protein NMY22_g11202 [Coprinellus aureogranulatus]
MWSVHLSAEEETLVSFIVQELNDVEDMTWRYNAELRCKDMNAFAEAYIAALAAMDPPPLSLSQDPAVVDAEIQKFAVVKKRWDADPNPNRKEKMIRMLTAPHYNMLLMKKASRLPENLRSEYQRRYKEGVNRRAEQYIGLGGEMVRPAQPNAALQQLIAQYPSFSGTQQLPRAPTQSIEDEDCEHRLPPYIVSKPLQASDIEGTARLLTAKERRNYAERPETAIGKVFRTEGTMSQGEVEVFKVRGVLSVEEDKWVYRLSPDCRTNAYGEPLDSWQSIVNPTTEYGTKVYEIVKGWKC